MATAATTTQPSSTAAEGTSTVPSAKAEGEMENNWSFPFFGCFTDPKLCIITFCLPCFTNGRTAEAVGDDCIFCCIGYFFLGCIAGMIVRGKVRDKKNIAGNVCIDLLAHLFCPLCALVQDNREVCDTPYRMAMARVWTSPMETCTFSWFVKQNLRSFTKRICYCASAFSYRICVLTVSLRSKILNSMYVNHLMRCVAKSTLMLGARSTFN